MQTNFSPKSLLDPQMAASEQVLRTCVHCGFCTATCPTYQLLGDELDSPRGRIYLMKDMLENERPATAETVKHIDRCLSCLSCMSTCPSGVNYMHLVDHGREYIEKTYKRPWPDRLLRSLLAHMLPYPARFRIALSGARIARPLRGLTRGRLRAMLDLAPKRLPPSSKGQNREIHKATVSHGVAYKGRVVLLAGCAQRVIAPHINAATIRLLTRLGYDVLVPGAAGCCGALTHHLGKTDASHASARANINAWMGLHQGPNHQTPDQKKPDQKTPNQKNGLKGIIINTSGCGTTVKDYGFMFRNDPEMAAAAATVSALAKDVSEFLDENKLIGKLPKQDLKITYHSACSLQHGQQVKTAPANLLKRAGFTVKDVPLGHLCCGSAGTYNILQPKIAKELRDRKVENIQTTHPDIIAAGNVGCITQIAGGTDTPVLHTVELLDWALGGPKPDAIAHLP